MLMFVVGLLLVAAPLFVPLGAQAEVDLGTTLGAGESAEANIKTFGCWDDVFERNVLVPSNEGVLFVHSLH